MRLAYLFSFFICCSFVSSLAGVSPGSYVFDFEPGFEKEVSFNFIFDEGVETEIYVSGDLASYVSLNKNSLIGGGVVIASISLPLEIESPGENRIIVGARQKSSGKGISLMANVQGLIKIKVPYPGEYVEPSLSVSNANIGEAVNYNLIIYNQGNSSIEVSPMIQVFADGKLRDSLNLDKGVIDFSGEETYSGQISTENYPAGNYLAVAIVEYGDGEFARSDDEFRLGEFIVRVNNYTRVLSLGDIEKFFIDIESFWNSPIEEVFAEVSVLGTESSFITPTIWLDSWENEKLYGFFDGSGLRKGKYPIEIIIHYGNSSSQFSGEILLVEGFNPLVYILILVIIGLLGVVVWRFFILYKKFIKKKF